MEHPKAVGDRTTVAVMAALQANGYAILVPFGENTRYDLAIDDGTGLRRVQCKTGRLREGGIHFAACSSYGHHLRPKDSRRDYRGEIDFFGVYCPETSGVYLVPIDDVDVRVAAVLRVSPSRNNQHRGVRPAGQYEIARVAIAAAPIGVLRGRAGAGGSSA